MLRLHPRAAEHGGWRRRRAERAAHASLVIFNNYGRHATTFRARATAILSDWVGFDASLAGVGSLRVNGEFLAWMRWMCAGLESIADIFEADEVLGKPLDEVEQLMSFKDGRKTGGGKVPVVPLAAPTVATIEEQPDVVADSSEKVAVAAAAGSSVEVAL